jgi:two-component system, OmpR family, phosphate regulon sensor histidine kinase PhoR
VLFNNKYISLLFSLAVAVTVFSAALIFYGTGDALNIALIIIPATFSVTYIALHFLVIKKLQRIYTLLENIRKEDYSFEKKHFHKDPGNPLNFLEKEISDFAEKKQAEINELKKLETFRREFLADVSHELKTPIFAAQGFVHTLIDGAVEDLKVRDRFLEKAANSLDALNVLVGDLITISQLEIGEIKMQPSNFDLRKLTEVVFDQLEDAANKRNIKLRIYKYSPRSCYVYADKFRISQVLTNLVMNAIKYGNENGLVVVSFNAGNDEVDVSVKDNGPGIASHHLKRIFERFYRIDKSRSRDLGGTGLGLSIVKHILEAHNSRISVRSKVGEGTIFEFKLKLGKVINENG